MCLTNLACFRQAKLDDITLQLFSKALVGYDMRAFQVACDNLKNTPRQEGETAFPDFGTILIEMDACRERFPRSGSKEVNAQPIVSGPQPIKRLK